MLQITVTGKVDHVNPADPGKGINYITFMMSERRWANGTAYAVVWLVAVPSFLEKAATTLVREGKSIGVSARNLQYVVVKDAASGEVPAFWVEADQLFIL